MIKHLQFLQKPRQKKKNSSEPIATIKCPVCKSNELIERQKKNSNDLFLKCKLCDWEFAERVKPPKQEVTEEVLSEDSIATLKSGLDCS